MLNQLRCKRVYYETRIARGEVSQRLRVLLLVSTNVFHRGQAARDGVRRRRDALTKRKGRKDAHEEDAREVFGANDAWQQEGASWPAG